MRKVSFKARYEPEKPTAVATVAVNAGDFKLRASVTDATFSGGPSVNGLTLGVESPGSFIVDYNVPKKDIRVQLMGTVEVLEKPLNLTCIHSQSDMRTILGGTLVIDSANKVSANHVLHTCSTKLKYTYLHRGLTTFEPSYDLGKKSWDFSASHKLKMFTSDMDDVFRATYETSSKNLGLEWLRNTTKNGTLKLMASVNLAGERKMAKICAETTWDFVI